MNDNQSSSCPVAIVLKTNPSSQSPTCFSYKKLLLSIRLQIHHCASCLRIHHLARSSSCFCHKNPSCPVVFESTTTCPTDHHHMQAQILYISTFLFLFFFCFEITYLSSNLVYKVGSDIYLPLQVVARSAFESKCRPLNALNDFKVKKCKLHLLLFGLKITYLNLL